MSAVDRTLSEVFASLDRMRADDAEKAAAARKRAAELAILTRFDLVRHSLGHDYGGGQRRTELGRIERDLEPDLVSIAYAAAGITLPASMLERAGEPLTAVELEAAYQRVGAPRVARVGRESYRRSTPGTTRTLRAWARLDAWLKGLEAAA